MKPVRKILRQVMDFLSFFNVFVVTIMLWFFIIYLYKSSVSPFYGNTATDWWIMHGNTKIDKPHVVSVYHDDPIYVGRTICVNKEVFGYIYKELDAVNTPEVFPILDIEGQMRVLKPGCQDRISPFVFATSGYFAPKPGKYQLRIWFIVPRNPFLELVMGGPLVEELQPVSIVLR
jgi:hypothetical protein